MQANYVQLGMQYQPMQLQQPQKLQPKPIRVMRLANGQLVQVKIANQPIIVNPQPLVKIVSPVKQAQISSAPQGFVLYAMPQYNTQALSGGPIFVQNGQLPQNSQPMIHQVMNTFPQMADNQKIADGNNYTNLNQNQIKSRENCYSENNTINHQYDEQFQPQFLSTNQVQHLPKAKSSEEAPTTPEDDGLKRRYARVSNEQRDYFLDMVHNKQIKLKRAAQLADIGYENAKAINKVFRKEGRNHRKQYKDFVKNDQLLKKQNNTEKQQSCETTRIISQEESEANKEDSFLNFNSKEISLLGKREFNQISADQVDSDVSLKQLLQQNEA